MHTLTETKRVNGSFTTLPFLRDDTSNYDLHRCARTSIGLASIRHRSSLKRVQTISNLSPIATYRFYCYFLTSSFLELVSRTLMNHGVTCPLMLCLLIIYYRSVICYIICLGCFIRLLIYRLSISVTCFNMKLRNPLDFLRFILIAELRCYPSTVDLCTVCSIKFFYSKCRFQNRRLFSEECFKNYF